jgi:hypothetical protein
VGWVSLDVLFVCPKSDAVWDLMPFFSQQSLVRSTNEALDETTALPKKILVLMKIVLLSIDIPCFSDILKCT